MRLRTGSLFSGYGGLDLAVNAFYGSETAWHVEYEAAPSKILAHHWPEVPNHGDVTRIDWAAVEPVDILTGGFPCQDVSAAGRRAGLMKGTRTGLFHNTIEAIDALRPRWVVLENVAGLLSADGEPWPDELTKLDAEVQHLRKTIDLIDGAGHAWGKKCDHHERNRLVRRHKRTLARFNTVRRRSVQRAIGTVVGELAAIGYDAQWTTLSASDVGACHRRERVFILATPADAEHGRWDGWSPHPLRGAVERTAAAGSGEGGSERGTLTLLPTLAANLGEHRRDRGQDPEKRRAKGRQVSTADVVCYLPTPRTSDTNGAGKHGAGGPDLRTAVTSWGDYGHAIRRAESASGSAAPAPTEPNTKGNPRLSAIFAEWMMMLPAGWVTDPAIGLSRNDQLKAIGNGVCPPQAYRALELLHRIAFLESAS